MNHLKSLLVLPFVIFVCESFASPISFEELTIEEAYQMAKEKNKFIFVDFYASWCKPCKVMEQQVFAVDSIGDFFNENFISIRVDAEKEQLDYVQKVGVTAYPTMVLYDPKGRQVYKHEGAMVPEDFYHLGESLVHLNERLANYNKNDRKLDNVYPYVTSMRWIDKKKASTAARKYLIELDERKYAEERNWELIATFVNSWDRVMFPRVVDSQVLPEERSEEYSRFMEASMQQLLLYAVDKGNSAHLKTRERYIQKLHPYLSNKDSLLLVGQVYYASVHKVEEYPVLIERYVANFFEEDADDYASLAYHLSQNYFQKPVLQFASELANRSIALKPNLYAYLALTTINERLIQYKAAYGNLLLAYQYADRSTQLALDELERELKQKMEFELKSGVSLVEEVSEDGRFTLGAGLQRLMYGYPVPQSTSHFIVNIDGKLASNGALRVDMDRLSGVSVYSGLSGTPSVKTKYEYRGVTIIQELVPVDKQGVEISQGLAQYYKITYTFSTNSGKPKRIGLGVLFDTMMDDNDECPIMAQGQMIPYEYGFSKSIIPDELLFFRTANDTSDLVGSALLDKLDATKPDLLVVGRWPYLYRVSWKLEPQKVPYGDSAYFLRWDNRNLTRRSAITFTTYYGLPDWKPPMLRLIMKDDKSTLTMNSNIYFTHNSDQLDINAKMKISELVDNPSIDIVGVILKGYADISGGSSYNFDLSKRRIESVGKIFKALEIPYVPKPYGFEKSDRDMYSERYGNAFDRKVEIQMYYRLKRENELLEIELVD